MVTYTIANSLVWSFDAKQPLFGLVGEGGMVLPAGAKSKTRLLALRPEALDFETRVAHDVRVRAANGAGLYHDASVCIALTNVSKRKAADRRKAVGQHSDGR